MNFAWFCVKYSLKTLINLQSLRPLRKEFSPNILTADNVECEWLWMSYEWVKDSNKNGKNQ